MIKKRVLIIDDSPLVLAMAKDFLEDAGYTVFTATNGIDANHFIFSADSKPDLIILDIMMPLLAGNKKAAMLQQSEHSKHIPIVFISSKPEGELKQLVIDTGVNGHICKPFTKQGLINAVRSHI